MMQAEGPLSGLSLRERGLLFAGLAVLSMGQATLIPAFGLTSRDAGLSEAQVGVIMSVSALIVVFAAPWWGGVCDRIGRKPVFVLGLVGFWVTTLAFLLAMHGSEAGWLGSGALFAALLAIRAAYAATASGALPAASGLIADTSLPEVRSSAMSLTGIAFSAGALAGTGLVYAFAPRLGALGPLAIVCGVGIVVSAGAVLGLRPPVRATPPCGDKQTSRIASGPLIPVLAVSFAACTAMSMIQFIMPYALQDAGGLATAQAVQSASGLAFVLSLSTIGSLWLASRSRLPEYRQVRFGLMVVAAGALCLALVSQAWGQVVAHVMLGAGFGFFVPAVQGLVSLRVGPTHQAGAAGLLSAATTAGYIVGPVLGASLYAQSVTLAFTAAAALTVVALLIGWWVGVGLIRETGPVASPVAGTDLG